jgi:lipoprotein-anchoring transpeptidase ErfK/SrfK
MQSIRPSLPMLACFCRLTSTIRTLGLLACVVWSGLSLPAQSAQVVSFAGEEPGSIVVRTNQRRLYLVVSDGKALSYPVGVGRAGKQWSGVSQIASKHLKPAWSPPAELKRDKPSLPSVIPSGSPRNPMGAAALVLATDQYAIHGTNAPGSIGGFVSYGCIRMHNKDILDLYDRVSVGTRVVVTR